MPKRPHRPPPAGDATQMLARLAPAEGNAVRSEGSGHLRAAVGIGCRPGREPGECLALELPQYSTNGLGVVGQMSGNPGRRPAIGREQDHLAARGAVVVARWVRATAWRSSGVSVMRSIHKFTPIPGDPLRRNRRRGPSYGDLAPPPPRYYTYSQHGT